MVTALAANFRKLNPPPIGGAPQYLSPREEHLRERRARRQHRRLRRLSRPGGYRQRRNSPPGGSALPLVINELTNWGKERGQIPARPDTSAIMSPVAHSLTRPQIEAVAAFVSELR